MFKVYILKFKALKTEHCVLMDCHAANAPSMTKHTCCPKIIKKIKFISTLRIIYISFCI
jgi:hypothetical protein